MRAHDEDLRPNRASSGRFDTRGSELLAAGWLPERAAARVLGCSVGVLQIRARAGVVRARSIGPSATLYEIKS